MPIVKTIDARAIAISANNFLMVLRSYGQKLLLIKVDLVSEK